MNLFSRFRANVSFPSDEAIQDSPYLIPVLKHLSSANKLDDAALSRARRLSSESGERLAHVLTRLGIVSEQDLAEAYAAVSGFPLISAAEFPPSPLLENQFNSQFLHSTQVIPIDIEDGVMVVAMADPLDPQALAALRFAARMDIRPKVACAGDIETALGRLYGGSSQEAENQDAEKLEAETEDVDRLKDVASEAPVIRLVNQIINKAVEARASDIHIEPMDNDLKIRFRIDGHLREMEAPHHRLGAAIVSRVKILAKLNIAERRLAQDGRIRLAVRGKEVDFRVSTTPTIFGESVVLRILDRGHLALDFDELGFDALTLARFRTVLNRPHGILLVTGPTGSGKTTTLYTSLHELNTPDKKILTIEDPVEYQLKGINQVQVKPQIGLTFANALRSFLRQDPDIMMIGEIRDLETAQIAIQAALTGHLVLSTLHTNDAASAVTRLLDMGVEDFLLTSTINGLVSQRLVRRLCRQCREPHHVLPGESGKLRLAQGAQAYRAVGCAACNGTGYYGRTSILEILQMTDAIRQLVLAHAEANQIQQAAERDGMESMYAHGMRKVALGETTIEEVLRVTRETP